MLSIRYVAGHLMGHGRCIMSYTKFEILTWSTEGGRWKVDAGIKEAVIGIGKLAMVGQIVMNSERVISVHSSGSMGVPRLFLCATNCLKHLMSPAPCFGMC